VQLERRVAREEPDDPLGVPGAREGEVEAVVGAGAGRPVVPEVTLAKVAGSFSRTRATSELSDGGPRRKRSLPATSSSEISASFTTGGSSSL